MNTLSRFESVTGFSPEILSDTVCRELRQHLRREIPETVRQAVEEKANIIGERYLKKWSGFAVRAILPYFRHWLVAELYRRKWERTTDLDWFGAGRSFPIREEEA